MREGQGKEGKGEGTGKGRGGKLSDCVEIWQNALPVKTETADGLQI